MSEKKRKRSGRADEEHSANRPALASQDQVIHVSVIQDDEAWLPVLAIAPGLGLPSTLRLKPYRKPRQNAKRKASEILLQASKNPKLDYVAREQEGNSVEKLLSSYIGVFDRETNSLQMVPARKVTVRATLCSNSASDSAKDEDDPFFNSLSARSTLGLAFGTKKAQKAIRARTENTITPAHRSTTTPLDPVAAAILNGMTSSRIVEQTRQELQAAIADAKPGPKPNLQAQSPVDVYSLEDLVGFDTLRILAVRDWQDKVRAGADIVTKSRFVSGRVRKVADSGDVRKLKALKYLLLLVQWYHCFRPGRKGVKALPSKKEVEEVVEGASEEIRNGFAKRFAEGVLLNKWHTSNLQLHICALALLVDDWVTDVHDIGADLRLEMKKIKTLHTQLGCRISALTAADLLRHSLNKKEAGAHRMAKLALPLEFPKTERI